ncbi:flippase [Clostridium sp. 29_15]|uniref:flippase n=1 Tax=Clostridium sp. 29_15 TaxID=1896982 RepID=UPI0009678DAE|nr:flippase [Clostridium sp. 29_15]OKZ87677.1 MAG: flippase [Clostridium sp. 29_15]
MTMSVKKNYLYNLLYQMTSVLLPVLTIPYVSRVLSADGIGINTVTYANTQYFILLGSLGISIYATKKIATIREKKDKLKKTFWEIFSIQFTGCILAYMVFALTLGQSHKYGVFYMLQGFYILAAAVDISWYFLGIENFKNASLRSFFAKIISVILIFIFVKTRDDLWKYILINAGTMFVGQLIMWFYVGKDMLKVKEIGKLKIAMHIMPILALFVPQIATQVYTVLDKTMIDLFKGAVEAGYYDQSQKIVRILLSVVTSLGIVMLPRIANLFSKDDLNEVKKSLRKAFVVISFLSIPITFGLIGISDKFVPILFGNEFLSVIPLTKISPVLVIIIGLGNVFGTQYLLAIGKNKEYTASVCIGALVNFCFNLLLIPRFAAMGAVIATVSAELSIALIQFWFARVVFDFTWIKETYKYWVSGILMLAIVRLVGNVTPISILFLVLQIAIGSLVYFISLIILRDKFLFEAIENVIDRIRKR